MVELSDPSDDDIASARALGERMRRGPVALRARYVPGQDRIEIDLSTGWSVQVPRGFSARLAAAPVQACDTIEIIDGGLGLHWPLLDEDWFVPSVLEALAAVPRAA